MENSEKEFKMTDRDFDFLSAKAYDISGIVLGEHKKPLLYSRIARRIRALKLNDFAEYCNYLEGHEKEELSNFLNSITTNLTSFFRESHHFEFLTKEFIPQVKSRPKDQPIRIWSSACSTGQEPYSIAITLYKNLNLNRNSVKILATDLDSNVINKGRSGEYSLDEIEQMPRDYLKYFMRNERAGVGKVKDDIREMIQFNRLNLLGPWPIKVKFDVIFCRNVVIYFNKETQKQLFSRLADHLVTGGYLIIGHSETLVGVNNQFESKGRTIYQKVGP